MKIISLLLVYCFAFVVPAAAQEHADAAERLKNITVLGLSNSNTEGDIDAISYLFPLWERLLAAGYGFEFIGPHSRKCRIGNLNHGIFSGRKIKYLDSHIDSVYRKYPANIILLQTGYKHTDTQNQLDSIIAGHQTIIRKVLAINSMAMIFVANVFGCGKQPGCSNIPELNRRIEKMVRELKSSNIVLVKIAKSFNHKIHPHSDNLFASQSEPIADAWFKALKKVLPKRGQSFHPELVTYKKTEKRGLSLHVFQPKRMKSGEKRPAIVFFFGGGWSVGTPLQFYRECAYFASKGFVAFAVDYRIASLDHSTPFDSVEDAKDAIRWIRSNAAKWNIDSERIAAAGASAGGHLAAATGTLKEHGNIQAAPDYKPDLLLLYYPVIDNSKSGYGPDSVKARYQDFSPLHNIDRTTPPALFILGTKDHLIPVKTAEAFRSRMEENGVECELHLFEGAGHPIFYYAKPLTPYFYSIRKMTENFLAKYGFLP